MVLHRLGVGRPNPRRRTFYLRGACSALMAGHIRDFVVRAGSKEVVAVFFCTQVDRVACRGEGAFKSRSHEEGLGHDGHGYRRELAKWVWEASRSSTQKSERGR